MTLTRAIDIILNLENPFSVVSISDRLEAAKLLAEAGKAIQAVRVGTPGLNLSRLPGETPKERRA